MKNIIELKNKHKGKDIYILGSGKTMDYISSSFFNNKITIGVNQLFRHFPCTYIVMTHGKTGQECINSGHTLISSKYRRACEKDKNIFDGNYYIFEHFQNLHQEIDLSALDIDNMLPVSCSTITPAISLAYKLGATNIILCGCDCGYIDGESNFEAYYSKRIDLNNTSVIPNLQHSEPQLYKLVCELRTRGINIYSLNPFINAHLEGHKYQHRVKDENRTFKDCYVNNK